MTVTYGVTCNVTYRYIRRYRPLHAALQTVTCGVTYRYMRRYIPLHAALHNRYMQRYRPLHAVLRDRYMQRYRSRYKTLHATLKKNSDLKIANHYKKVRVFLRPNFLHEAAYNVGLQHMALQLNSSFDCYVFCFNLIERNDCLDFFIAYRIWLMAY